MATTGAAAGSRAAPRPVVHSQPLRHGFESGAPADYFGEKDAREAIGDADVLVILEVDPRPFMERIPEFRRWFLDVPIDVEVFPYTRDETVKGQADPGSFIHSVMTGPIEVLA